MVWICVIYFILNWKSLNFMGWSEIYCDINWSPKYTLIDIIYAVIGFVILFISSRGIMFSNLFIFLMSSNYDIFTEINIQSIFISCLFTPWNIFTRSFLNWSDTLMARTNASLYHMTYLFFQDRTMDASSKKWLFRQEFWYQGKYGINVSVFMKQIKTTYFSCFVAFGLELVMYKKNKPIQYTVYSRALKYNQATIVAFSWHLIKTINAM